MLASKKFAESRFFWALTAYLAFVFLLGGSSRYDVTSLPVLRPVSAIILFAALWWTNRDVIERHRGLVYFAFATLVAVAIQLIPLPPGLWHNLPGRELAVEIDSALGRQSTWRPISMVPTTTWNALFSLLIPLATLVLAINLTRDQLFRLVSVILAVGFLSGLLGILQILGPNNGPLYFYHLTNFDSAVGFFANRNHQAVFLAFMFPLLAVFASSRRTEESHLAIRRLWIAVCGGIFLIPLLLVTGSRAGLIAGLLGACSVQWIYRKAELGSPTKKRGKAAGKGQWLGDRKLRIAAAVAGGLVIMLVLFLGRNFLSELASQDVVEDKRFQVFGTITALIWKYFPVGSGFGTFPDVFKIAEPDSALGPSYLNHAHNDWLELMLSGGVIAFALIAAVIWFVVRSAMVVAKSDKSSKGGLAVPVGRAALVIVLLAALASIFDYPVRVPSMTAVMVIVFVWLYRATTPEKKIDGLNIVVWPDRQSA